VGKEKIHFYVLLTHALDKGKDKMSSREKFSADSKKSLVQKADFKTFPQSVQSIHILICYFSKAILILSSFTLECKITKFHQ
jgi:hypothetical protein